ncbi:hypothetical protein FQA39_LY12485 [Lamprigera yunnana]|nr:hypothetical protein FQA39_LY12485 [Lamprigera yunnana]
MISCACSVTSYVTSKRGDNCVAHIVPVASEQLVFVKRNRQAYINASPYQNDLDEDSTFYSEILEDLETHILYNENNDIELEIFERPEDDDDEGAED